ncbi:hypothetical protein [Embleya sp. NPDC005971]|uniref:hypothetical protein n=1 Tax=Embleya sp. NPDC005971 TaxID=3156724 RepID=UPI0033D1E768
MVKRTFFHTFAGKEDVVMAPTQDMWTAFTEEWETRPVTGGTVRHFLRDALLAAVDRMTNEAWSRRVRLGRRLAATNPAVTSSRPNSAPPSRRSRRARPSRPPRARPHGRRIHVATPTAFGPALSTSRDGFIGASALP